MSKVYVLYKTKNGCTSILGVYTSKEKVKNRLERVYTNMINNAYYGQGWYNEFCDKVSIITDDYDSILFNVKEVEMDTDDTLL